MNLSFPQLLGILLLGLGGALLISAIRPAASYIGAASLVAGTLSLIIGSLRKSS